MKHFITLYFSLLSLYAICQEEVTDFNYDTPYESTASAPELYLQFKQYIPLYERIPLKLDTTQRNEKGDIFFQYLLTDKYFQIYQDGYKNKRGKNGLWNYYFFGSSTKDQSNQYAIRSNIVFKDDQLIEYLGSFKSFKIESKSGLSPEVSQQVINIIEYLELKSPSYITGLSQENIGTLRFAANRAIKDILKKGKSTANIFIWEGDSLQSEDYFENGELVKSIWYDLYTDPLSDKVSIEGRKIYRNEKLILQEKSYRNDPSHKNIELYFPNGKLRAQGSYVDNDIKSGKWTVYHVNGEKSEVGYYKHGEKTGKWKEFDEDGKLIKKIVY